MGTDEDELLIKGRRNFVIVTKMKESKGDMNPSKNGRRR